MLGAEHQLRHRRGERHLRRHAALRRQTQEAEGDRVFDLPVQGEQVLEKSDIYAEAGGMNTAYTHTVEDVEVSEESLLVETTTRADATSIPGIEVRES